MILFHNNVAHFLDDDNPLYEFLICKSAANGTSCIKPESSASERTRNRLKSYIKVNHLIQNLKSSLLDRTLSEKLLYDFELIYSITTHLTWCMLWLQILSCEQNSRFSE